MRPWWSIALSLSFPRCHPAFAQLPLQLLHPACLFPGPVHLYCQNFTHCRVYAAAAAAAAVAAAAKSLQSCPTLCDPIDDSPPGSSIPGILQARIPEWVAISFSNACMHT